MTTLILAIDLGKYKGVPWLDDPTSAETRFQAPTVVSPPSVHPASPRRADGRSRLILTTRDGFGLTTSDDDTTRLDLERLVLRGVIKNPQHLATLEPEGEPVWCSHLGPGHAAAEQPM